MEWIGGDFSRNSSAITEREVRSLLAEDRWTERSEGSGGKIELYLSTALAMPAERVRLKPKLMACQSYQLIYYIFHLKGGSGRLLCPAPYI